MLYNPAVFRYVSRCFALCRISVQKERLNVHLAEKHQITGDIKQKSSERLFVTKYGCSNWVPAHHCRRLSLRSSRPIISDSFFGCNSFPVCRFARQHGIQQSKLFLFSFQYVVSHLHCLCAAGKLRAKTKMTCGTDPH